ncbi:hypothetical protein ABIA35_000861 [Catenulispora sp. MAP12-49]
MACEEIVNAGEVMVPVPPSPAGENVSRTRAVSWFGSCSVSGPEPAKIPLSS